VRVWSQAVGFVLQRLAGIWLVAITMFYRQTSFIKEFNKFCAFFAICKHDAAINYFTDDHKEVSF
jgi:hypothetical protein